MTPIDAALDDLSAEQERRRKTIAHMVKALKWLGFENPIQLHRIAAYRAFKIKREDWSVLDWRALSQFNKERDS